MHVSFHSKHVLSRGKRKRWKCDKVRSGEWIGWENISRLKFFRNWLSVWSMRVRIILKEQFLLTISLFVCSEWSVSAWIRFYNKLRSLLSIRLADILPISFFPESQNNVNMIMPADSTFLNFFRVLTTEMKLQSMI